MGRKEAENAKFNKIRINLRIVCSQNYLRYLVRHEACV
jgi:hypothetical protein